MKYEAVILDMDGTIVDTERVIIELLEDAAIEAGGKFSREALLSMIGAGTQETLELMRVACPGVEPRQLLTKMSQLLEIKRATGGIGVKKGLFSLLEAAKAVNAKVAVCTSTRRKSAEATLRSAGLDELAKVMVCGGEASQGKPYPEPYLLAAKLLEVLPEACLAVEDSPRGAQSARDAGMKVVCVPDLLPAPDWISAEDVFESLEEVASLLKMA
ncbi:MAG: HAD family phosphatase [Clostridiales bacterium]|jgi:beta-phosphoglucomutase-like phosphatase (HAD superfamily)|nr:HAD family phosphatase [Clostridiales bacterium]